MPTKTEIIEAGAGAIHESQCCPLDANSGCDLSDTPVSLVETALSAMLPLIKQALADSVRERHLSSAEALTLVQDRGWDVQKVNAYDLGIMEAVRIIEDFEL